MKLLAVCLILLTGCATEPQKTIDVIPTPRITVPGEILAACPEFPLMVVGAVTPNTLLDQHAAEVVAYRQCVLLNDALRRTLLDVISVHNGDK